MMSYIKKQIAEIQDSRVLTYFAFFLTVIHGITWYSWGPLRNNTLVLTLTSKEPICWLYFPGCSSIRPLEPWLAKGLLVFYISVVLITLLLVVFKRTKLFWWALLFLTIYKWGLLSLDYRFMGNYHYMPLVATLVFLLVSAKKKFVPLMIISFYVGAGLLKFTPEWYSGSSLLRPPFFTGKFLEWSLVYVIYLEFLLVWGLLSSRNWLRWFTLLQLVAFHIFSWHIVGYFYPSVMFNVLMFFPLLWLVREKTPPRKIPWTRSGVLALTIFWAAQLLPFTLYRNSALTGEGRMFSLNMLDAWSVCESTALVSMKGNQQLILSLPAQGFGVRIHCDPLVYIARLKEECRYWQNNPDFIDMDYVLTSKLKTDHKAVEVLRLKKACSHPPRMNFMGSVSQ